MFMIITIIVTIGIVWIPFIIEPKYEPMPIITLVLINLFVVVLPFSIKYVVEGTKLKIYTFCFHSDIDIKTITKMQHSRSIISSPAASLNRLAIHYGKGNVAIISPRRQDEFIALLNTIAEKEIPYIP